VDQQIKEYADTLYLDALLESSETVRKNRVAQAQKSAVLVPARLPISGVNIQNQARIYEAHVERCMDARLRSYQLAYADTTQTPSEEDFRKILDDCRAVRGAEVEKSTKALKELIGSHSPIGADVIDKMVENARELGTTASCGNSRSGRRRCNLGHWLRRTPSRRRILTRSMSTARFSLSTTFPALPRRAARRIRVRCSS
jgi:hypothetical protein